MTVGAARNAVWLACAMLALIVLPLLLRNLLAIPAHVPLDPNEGWNAVHALRAGTALYPPPGAWLVNNYPPLSFHAVAALTRLTGDAIMAGRILSALSFFAVCGGIAVAARLLGARVRAMLLAALFFAAVLLVGSDYVAMDDPQLLGHAVQMAGLLLALRGRVVAAALLFAVALFIKHNLLALPIATGLLLCVEDRRAGLRFITTGLLACGAGLILFRIAYGTSLLAQLASSRLSSLDNLKARMFQLWWAVLPLALLAVTPHGAARRFCLFYAGAALMLGIVFCAGDGVDTNIFFDLAIALSLTLAVTADAALQNLLRAACALPLLAALALTFTDNGFLFTRAFADQSAHDIALLKARPGPALCDQLSLCLWAGKTAEVDVFNIGEAIKTGARDPSALTARIASRDFAVLQLSDADSLGPAVRSAIENHYRIDHSDDNGTFWIPKPAP